MTQRPLEQGRDPRADLDPDLADDRAAFAVRCLRRGQSDCGAVVTNLFWRRREEIHEQIKAREDQARSAVEQAEVEVLQSQ